MVMDGIMMWSIVPIESVIMKLSMIVLLMWMKKNRMLEIQLLIIHYKKELKVNPTCRATKALLARSRSKLLSLKLS